jgi:hypothetical protein
VRNGEAAIPQLPFAFHHIEQELKEVTLQSQIIGLDSSHLRGSLQPAQGFRDFTCLRTPFGEPGRQITLDVSKLVKLPASSSGCPLQVLGQAFPFFRETRPDFAEIRFRKVDLWFDRCQLALS